VENHNLEEVQHGLKEEEYGLEKEVHCTAKRKLD
jgi:hypothetical protein